MYSCPKFRTAMASGQDMQSVFLLVQKTYEHEHVYACIFIYTYIHVAYIESNYIIYIYIYIYMYTYTHMYTYVYVYIYIIYLHPCSSATAVRPGCWLPPAAAAASAAFRAAPGPNSTRPRGRLLGEPRPLGPGEDLTIWALLVAKSHLRSRNKRKPK